MEKIVVFSTGFIVITTFHQSHNFYFPSILLIVN